MGSGIATRVKVVRKTHQNTVFSEAYQCSECESRTDATAKYCRGCGKMFNSRELHIVYPDGKVEVDVY